MKKILYFGPIICGLVMCSLTSCNPTTSKPESSPEVQQIKGNYKMWTTLTVAEGKRLIAKGLKHYAPVAENLQKGQVLITTGSTNHYIAEEFLNETLIAGSLLTGHLVPKKNYTPKQVSQRLGSVYLENGEAKTQPLNESIALLKEGAIAFKGGNLLNYRQKKAAVLVGSPTGGTIGALTPLAESGKIRLIIPIGLEKDSSEDIEATVARIVELGQTPTLKFIPGEVFTEIEAIKAFANVEVIHIASGGIGGAEGAVTLLIRGEEEEISKVAKVLEEVQGEAPFFE
ncbi:hypothetical protein [Bacteroides sp. 51]|uniref:hypothetical protein n=1 Tax=Bacteroides sp. 51 TaxID=2302938 RepID=UPI0013D1D8BD|nr:hypothetical protein [Bacteroides sp. 51]NDV81146.1 hypothetical protein [Bacteroides sp. 51]